MLEGLFLVIELLNGVSLCMPHCVAHLSLTRALQDNEVKFPDEWSKHKKACLVHEVAFAANPDKGTWNEFCVYMCKKCNAGERRDIEERTTKVLPSHLDLSSEDASEYQLTEYVVEARRDIWDDKEFLEQKGTSMTAIGVKPNVELVSQKGTVEKILASKIVSRQLVERHVIGVRLHKGYMKHHVRQGQGKVVHRAIKARHFKKRPVGSHRDHRFMSVAEIDEKVNKVLAKRKRKAPANINESGAEGARSEDTDHGDDESGESESTDADSGSSEESDAGPKGLHCDSDSNAPKKPKKTGKGAKSRGKGAGLAKQAARRSSGSTSLVDTAAAAPGNVGLERALQGLPGVSLGGFKMAKAEPQSDGETSRTARASGLAALAPSPDRDGGFEDIYDFAEVLAGKVEKGDVNKVMTSAELK